MAKQKLHQTVERALPSLDDIFPTTKSDGSEPLGRTTLQQLKTALAYTYAELSGKPSLGTASTYGVATSGNAASNELVKGSDSRLTDSRTALPHPHNISDVSNLQEELNSKPTLSNGIIPNSYLPAYVDDVLEFATLEDFPATGETGKIYVSIATNLTYRWGGSSYTKIADGAVTSVNGNTGAVTITKASIGLDFVDNTSDVNKPISTATQNALDAKLPTATFTAHSSNTSNPHSVTKAQVGLGNVDDTSDVNKPISTATQTALDLKASITLVTTHTGNTANPHNVTKAQVGLGNVDNTSDMNKPVSTATLTALATKEPLIDELKTFYLFNDFIALSTQYPFSAIQSNSGTISNVTGTGEQGRVGTLSFNSNTTNNAIAGIYLGVSILKFGGGVWTFEAEVKMNTLSTDTEGYGFMAGFGDAITGVAQTDGAYFVYDSRGVYSGSALGTWQTATADGGTRYHNQSVISATTVDTEYTKLKIIINAAATLASFYVDNVLVATHTDGISVTGSTGITMIMQKNSGTGNRNCYADWVRVKGELTTSR